MAKYKSAAQQISNHQSQFIRSLSNTQQQLLLERPKENFNPSNMNTLIKVGLASPVKGQKLISDVSIPNLIPFSNSSTPFSP